MKKDVVQTSIAMLGTVATDRVTKFTGMVGSISFDAYGCIQAWLTPEAKDGKLGEGTWFDVKRLDFPKKEKRKMPVPNYAIAFGEEIGPETKRAPRAG